MLSFMEKLAKLITQIQGYSFLAAYNVEKNARIKIKLLALHHFQNYKSLDEVSSIVLYKSKGVKNWPKYFLTCDYEGLIER